MKGLDEPRARYESTPSAGGSSRTEGMLMDGRGYLTILARRKWIIVPVLILIPLAAYILAVQKEPVYEGSSQVYLNRQSQTLSGLEDPLIFQPERVIRTQADIARLPVIAKRVVEKAETGQGWGEFLGQSSVTSNEDIDLMTFNVRDEDPLRAATLANLYAAEYIRFRRELDTNALREASQAIRRQLASLEDQGLLVNSGLYGELSQKLQQLESAQVLLKSNALLVKEAEGAVQVEPRPLRNAALALAFAVALGLGVAFLVEALDTRVRDPEELADRLGLPMLGSLPQPPGALRARGRVVMLDHPNSSDAELFRMLRTGLEVTALQGGCRSIMVTSALAQEGKSTTAANLAVAFARTGRNVVLVDLDLRRPSLDRFFDIEGRPGITDLVSGRTSLGDAGVRLTFGDAFEPASAGVRLLRADRPEEGAKREPGILDVIGSGTLPPNPGEFMGEPALASTVEQLVARSDLVIVDGPPLLLAAEALTLSSMIDALLLVSRMNAFRRGQITELERLLASSPTVKLGLVATGHTAMPKRDYYGTSVWPSHDGERRPHRRPTRGSATEATAAEADEQLDIGDVDSGQSGRRSWT